jgi:hypothetical protein
VRTDGALYDYVARDDGCFAWNNTGRTISSGPNSTGGWVGYILTLTSQCWLTPADFTGPTGHVWTHQLVVVVPDRQPWAFPDAGALWITGGGNGDGDPDASSEDILVCASLATTVGVACASLFQIPQQPVVFSAEHSTLTARITEGQQLAFIVLSPRRQSAFSSLHATRV